MVAIGVCSAAMIIVFTAFNGFGSLVKEMYNNFYPDIKVTAAKGKFFTLPAARLAAVVAVPGVLQASTVIEDNVFADNHGQQKVTVLKGIDGNYFKVNELKEFIVQGDDTVSAGHPYTAIGGQHILNELGADINDVFSYIELFYPNPTVTNPEADPLSAYQSLRLHPAGAFRIMDEFDSKYILAPLPLVQELFHAKGKLSAIDIKTAPGAADDARQKIVTLLGPGWKVETRYEQNKTLYMIMGSEKWAVNAIMILVLIIASFNMVGALSMLVLEKQKDIAILRAMGADTGTIRGVFLLEGILWSMTGGGIGILVGLLVCLAQLQFGFVKIGGSAFLMESYPVKIELTDILLVIAIILTVGIAVSWYPALRATKAVDPSLKSA